MPWQAMQLDDVGQQPAAVAPGRRRVAAGGGNRSVAGRSGRLIVVLVISEVGLVLGEHISGHLEVVLLQRRHQGVEQVAGQFGGDAVDRPHELVLAPGLVLKMLELFDVQPVRVHRRDRLAHHVGQHQPGRCHVSLPGQGQQFADDAAQVVLRDTV